MSKDLFSKQSDEYALYRPVYPPELFEYILQYVEYRITVWDCATGNGQAAVALADYFERVLASDSSERQITNAVPRSNIEYYVGEAGKTAFKENSFDLITVAQAYHWLDAKAFAKEVRRVAKPGAVIAIWGYNIPMSDHAALNDLILFFYKQVVGSYWDKERRYIDDYYTTVEFDYPELPAKRFSIDVRWTIEHLRGYLNSWSSVQHYIKAKGVNPVNEFIPRLQDQWPEEKSVQFKFPVFMRLGKIEQ